MVESLLRVRERIWYLYDVKYMSAGALVELLSTFGDGGECIIERLNGVVPVILHGWLLYEYVNGWKYGSQSSWFSDT